MPAMREQQYARLNIYVRDVMAAEDWGQLSRRQKIDHLRDRIRRQGEVGPDLTDLIASMDRMPNYGYDEWGAALDACEAAIRAGAGEVM
jgi:hypothetical protein